MTERSAKRLARGLFGLIAGLFAISIAIGWPIRNVQAASTNWGSSGLLAGGLFLLVFSSFPIAGILLALRRPANAIGWILLGIGLAWGLSVALGNYAVYGLVLKRPGTVAGAALAAGFEQWLWVPGVGLSGSFLILLFPDGHLPSPRWRWFARLAAGGLVLASAVILFSPGTLADSGFPTLRNPFGVEALHGVLTVAQIAILSIPISFIGAATALVRRYRRSSGVERLQMKWLATAAALVAGVFLITMALSIAIADTGTPPTALAVLQDVTLLAFGLIPVAIGISVLKHRLYDIDVVISKTVVYGLLAAFITAVYVAVVVGIGTVVGNRGSAFLSAVAAAVVALAFQPVRRRAQHLANRLVYGRRATPYQVLSEFSDRLAGAFATEELLPRMARILGEGTGAARADVLVRVGHALQPGAVWPPDAEPLSSVSADPPPEDLIPIRHRGELLGALSVTKKPGETMSATEEKLVADFASQAGLVLRNASLTQELLAKLEELRASRQRLVAVQDEERRKIERNIHDGAQQQLVALAVKLRLTGSLVGSNDERARTMLSELQAETNEALENLRDLARGIYPPLLADKGLVAALESQARKSAVPVNVEPDGIGRYPPEVEAAVYFCCLEALQNVAKYSRASSVAVRLSATDTVLRFEVTDDGRGFDPSATDYGTGLQGIADRLAALGGELAVASAPGTGTRVAGWLPAGVRS